MRLADPPRAHAPLRNRPADPQPRARCRRIEQPVRVKFTGGREVTGTLQGFDALVNLVLDDCVEYLRGARPPARSPAPARSPHLSSCAACGRSERSVQADG